MCLWKQQMKTQVTETRPSMWEIWTESQDSYLDVVPSGFGSYLGSEPLDKNALSLSLFQPLK